jgi:hypothetical protein
MVWCSDKERAQGQLYLYLLHDVRLDLPAQKGVVMEQLTPWNRHS